MVRGKFQVTKVAKNMWSETSVEVTLSAVSNDGTPENERYHKYTPNGQITLTIDNPAAAAQFELKTFLYVDFTPTTKEGESERRETIPG